MPLGLFALANAGDPGPVVLRRLSNAEYTYTIRDLTGVEALDPAREFPVDGAAGEGFSNTGAALVMSPALLTKYLDAAKDIAAHAVLLPHGLAFSPSVSQRDWTEERLAAIRNFYAQFTVKGGGSAVNLQGIKFDTKDGGVLPLEKYLAATLAERDALTTKRKSIADIAKERDLNTKYLTTLWSALNDPQPSLVLDLIRALGQLRVNQLQLYVEHTFAFAGHEEAWQEASPLTPAEIRALDAAAGLRQSPDHRFQLREHVGVDGGRGSVRVGHPAIISSFVLLEPRPAHTMRRRYETRVRAPRDRRCARSGPGQE